MTQVIEVDAHGRVIDVVDAERLFQRALARVESEAIKEWATTPHNREVWIKIAQGAVERGSTDPCWFAAYMVCVALG